MKLLKNFQIENIVISEDFRNTVPGSEKVRRAEQHYLETGKLPISIVINDSNMLIDGYITYLLAVQYGVEQIDVYRGYVEVVEAVHYPGSKKTYMWRVPSDMIGKLVKGEKCIVRTGQGVKRVTVERILRQQYPIQNPRMRFVIKPIQKGGF